MMNGRAGGYPNPCSYSYRCSDTIARPRPGALAGDASALRSSAIRRHHRRRNISAVTDQHSAERRPQQLQVGGAKGRIVRETGTSTSSSTSTSTSNRRSSTALNSLCTPTRPAEQEVTEIPGTAQSYDVREAEAAEYWQVADVHCMSFYPSVRPPTLHFLRLDRVLALHLGRMISDNRKEINGKYRCVVAAAASPRRTAASTLAKWWSGLNSNGQGREDDGSVYAAIVVDTLAQYIPKRLQSSGTQARKAYISNLAVSSKLRRQGLAKAVLEKAEALAGQWTCDEIFLHCDPKNTAAYNLYVQAGYTVLDGQDERAAQPRQDVKLVLMKKCITDPLHRLPDEAIAA